MSDLLVSEEITQKTYDYLIKGGNRTSVFYMLPKIHKNLKKLPGRPIVSSVDSPTEKISQLIDVILKPLIIQNKSYLEDTPDFINKINSVSLSDEDWFVSLDVVSLYTNIPHDKGMHSVFELIKSKRHNELPTNRSIMKLLECVLKFNNFTFNEKHYLQIQGTAMGTRVAPTYANIYMNSFEEKYVYTYKSPPRYWFRFIDDIWCIFRGSKPDVEKFIEYLNLCDDTLKFTSIISHDSVPFLDVVTYRHMDQTYTLKKLTVIDIWISIVVIHGPRNKVSPTLSF